MKLKKLLKEEKELSLEVLVFGVHILNKLEFQGILKQVKKFKLQKKKQFTLKWQKNCLIN